jgi:hypothetical protein
MELGGANLPMRPPDPRPPLSHVHGGRGVLLELELPQ